MASVGRHSEPQAFVFDAQYIQFKPKDAVVTLYFSPMFMWKNQRPNQVNYVWYIQVVLTGKPDFGASNCPVRAFRYYNRYMTEHPELRKGRRSLFIPIKDNNARKEHSLCFLLDLHHFSGFSFWSDVSESFIDKRHMT